MGPFIYCFQHSRCIMAIRHNNVVCNNHLHKKWQTRVKTWFNQPARKHRRNQNRIKKARAVAPRPVKTLRPAVKCPTFKYNTRTRLGRGFSLEELKAAGINRHFARTIGIAVDHRRRNKNAETLQLNSQRLKEYKNNLILFPKNSAKPSKGDSSAEEIKMAVQVSGTVMPVKDTWAPDKARAITDEEKKHCVYQTIRKARSNAKLWGIRAKRKKEKEEAAAQAKPKKK